MRNRHPELLIPASSDEKKTGASGAGQQSGSVEGGSHL